MAKDFHAGEIPLVEPADQRFKIARLSAAAASRVFSTDAAGEKLIIRPEHVHFAVSVLYTLYCHPNFKYDQWSLMERTTDIADTGDLDSCFEKLKELPRWRKVLGLLLLPGQIETREIEFLMNGNRSESGAVIHALRILGLLEKKWGKYVKTARGVQLPQWLMEQKKISRGEIDLAMMDQHPTDGLHFTPGVGRSE